MKFSKPITIIIAVPVILTAYAILNNSFSENSEKNYETSDIEYIETVGKIFKILVNPDDMVLVNGKIIPLKAEFELKEDMEEKYKELGFFDNTQKPVFVIPTFTASAYSKNGFYDYYNQICDKQCLTTGILSLNNLDYSSSANAVKVLGLLGYDSITDLELHENPSILQNYNKIIILHNEYVSQIMFDAITSHKNVIFLYPNALYAKIQVDTSNNEITLVEGHGYPRPEITNGFDWENENTHPYEFDNKCENWKFYSISNGFMLNCYPENIIWNNEEFLKVLKEL